MVSSAILRGLPTSRRPDDRRLSGRRPRRCGRGSFDVAIEESLNIFVANSGQYCGSSMVARIFRGLVVIHRHRQVSMFVVEGTSRLAPG